MIHNVSRLLTALIIFVAVATAGAQTKPAQPIKHKTESISFFSKSLDGPTTCTVISPDPLVPGKKYPVVYMLHGYSGDSSDWTKYTSFTLAMTDHEMIAVMPDGGYSGWYLDSPLDPKNQYESLIVKDVVPEIDKRYPTVASREGRAIGGLSMGGHGAVTLAAKHPDVFCSASSLSGVLNLQKFSTGYKIESLIGDRKENKSLWEHNDAFALADNFTSANVALMFDCGTEDKLCFTEAQQFHEKLTNRGIRHTYNKYPGTHSWAYWGEHLPEHLLFHKTNMTQAIAGKPLKAGADVKDRSHQLYVDRNLQFEKETQQWLDDPQSTWPIVLLGSSTLHGFKEKELMPGLPVVNRGIGADRIGIVADRGVSHRLYNTIIALKPRAVIINNGTNDLGATSKTGDPKMRDVANEMEQVCITLLTELPDTQVFVNTCHTTRDTSAKTATYIQQYNLVLAQMVRKLDKTYTGRIHFIDHASKVASPDGLLAKEYAGDGLHLNRKGQEILRDCFMESLGKAGILDQLKK